MRRTPLLLPLLAVLGIAAQSSAQSGLIVAATPSGSESIYADAAKADAGYLQSQSKTMGVAPANLTTLTGAGATKQAVLKAVRDTAGRSDQRFIYLSLLGARDPLTAEPVLACADSRVVAGQMQNVIRASELKAALAASKTPSKLLVLVDASFNPLGLSEVKAFSTYQAKYWAEAPLSKSAAAKGETEDTMYSLKGDSYLLVTSTKGDLISWFNRTFVRPVEDFFRRAGSEFGNLIPAIVQGFITGNWSGFIPQLGDMIFRSAGTQIPNLADLLRPGGLSESSLNQLTNQLLSSLNGLIGLPVGPGRDIQLSASPSKLIYDLEEPLEIRAKVNTDGYMFLVNLTQEGRLELLPTREEEVPRTLLDYLSYAQVRKEKDPVSLGLFYETRPGLHSAIALFVKNDGEAAIVAATLLKVAKGEHQIKDGWVSPSGGGAEALKISKASASALLAYFGKPLPTGN